MARCAHGRARLPPSRSCASGLIDTNTGRTGDDSQGRLVGQCSRQHPVHMRRELCDAQRIERIKAVLFLITILLAGAAVSLAGNLVFVGLLVPHIVRAIVGPDYRFIIPSSALIGGTFMLLADTVARTVNAPYETPIIAVVAVLGLPFFLIIVRKGGRAFS